MKTAWTVLISLVVTAVIVGGGTYYFVNAQATKDKDNLQAQITTLSTKVADTEKSLADAQTTTSTPTTATTTTDKTASWKTYENKTLGFSFKYPTEWTISNEELPSTTASKNLIISNVAGGSELDLWVDADGFGPFFANLIYTLEKSGNGIAIAQREVAEKGENNSGAKSLIITKPIQLGSHNYLFHFTYNATDTGSEQTFKDILSTFQLTK